METVTPAAPTTPATTSAPASAPTSSDTSSSAAPTQTKKPASFGAALRQAEKQAAEAPSASTPATSANEPAAATVLPTDAGSPANRGPVPYDRFSEVNTRMQAAEKRQKEFETEAAQYAWAKGVDRQTLADTVRWRQRATTDLDGFLQDLITSAPPERQAALRSALARQLGTRPADTEPQPDLQTDRGEPVYSAKQQAAWTAWRERKQQAEFDKRLKPLQDELNAGRTERAKVKASSAAKSFATSTMKDAADWPHFTDNVAAIAEEYATHPVGKTDADEALALHRAYIAVLKRSVFPSISEKAQASVRADFQTKAAASSEHPGRASTSTPSTRPKSLGEALRREADKAGWR